MIPQQVIDDILNLDVSEVIGRYIQLTKKGADYKACCPFHQEKTPSFSVKVPKGIYKCFGCGKGGNAISFVMDFKKSSYPEAIREIAAAHHIEIPKTEFSEEDEKLFKEKEQLYIVNKLASEWFIDRLKENGSAYEYVKSRWSTAIIDEFSIGFAPDSWNSFMTWATGQGLKEEILLKAGLLSESKNKIFDSFRNRIIFPIHSRTGRIIGFTGRDFSGKEGTPKYFNTKETEIFNKGKSLYGLNTAYISMKEKGYVHLVEGNPDVILLQQIGKLNTIGTCGTSLTRDHIEEIRRYCQSITIIGDSDKAGQNAVIRSGKMIIDAGMFCNVVTLATEPGKKEDPDSFFKEKDEDFFDDYVKENIRDFILYHASVKKDKAKNPDLKSKLIDELGEMVIKLPKSSHELYIDQLSKIIQPKKAIQDKVKELLRESVPVEEADSGIPKWVSLSDYEKFGFYEDGNQYFFKTKQGNVRGSNFVMEPLFHISSIVTPKRLFKITNVYGFSHVFEFDQRDLITLSNFRLRLESIGNFLFEGSECDMNKLKRWLYEKTLTAFMIDQLGWQKKGFWAWSNGMFNGSFKDNDTNGIVSYENENFYIPSSSNVYQNEESLFVAERKFKFMKGKITLYDHSSKLIDVYGDNAIFGMCFLMASLFRDHIGKLFSFFPILNLFGPKGAGKTELAISLLQFFGPQKKGINIYTSSKPSLAEHVAMFSNALCHIDEYSNSLELEKIEYLKGLWDLSGRNVKNMDKDKKREESRVECGLMLSGQHMPTADIALYSRLVALTFSKVEYTEDEKLRFDNLKQIEKQGLGHLTHEILSHRQHFITYFLENYNETGTDMAKALNHAVIEDRIFRNWIVILAAYRTLKDLIHVPWEYESIIPKAAELIRKQNSETKKSNEMAIFWNIVEFLVNDGMIKKEVDFKIDDFDTIKTDILDSPKWSIPKKLILINHSRIFQQYRVHGKRAQENVLPVKTLEYYLKHSKEYMGKKPSEAFRIEVDGRIVEDKDEVGTSKKKCLRRITTALVFDYDLLHQNLGISINTDETEEEDVF